MSAPEHRQTQTQAVAPRDHTQAADSRCSRLKPCEQPALAQLYDCYAPMLYAIAFEQLGSVAASETVVLDVFEQFWQVTGSVSPGQPVGAELCQLAAQHLDTQTVELALLQSLSRAGQPKAARGSRVLRAFSQLTEPQQQALGLTVYQGFTLTQLAAQSDRSTSTVKTHLRLALRQLHTLLASSSSSEA